MKSGTGTRTVPSLLRLNKKIPVAESRDRYKNCGINYLLCPLIIVKHLTLAIHQIEGHRIV